MNFARDIEGAAGSENIICAVIGEFGRGAYDKGELAYGEGRHPIIPFDKRNVVLDWNEAREFLNYRYDDGFGGVDCHAFYAWTPTRVLFVSQYDGSTQVECIPRNPIDCEPDMPGG